MDAVTRAVCLALNAAPVSLREVGRRAGISHAQLARIVAAERKATLRVARAVADALDAIGTECGDSATGIRRSLTNQRGKR
jgi:transcriptional regulator with XRE-family HTH domain